MNPKLANAAANLKRRAQRRFAARVRHMPSVWLMTDEARLADPEAALAQLPRGAGLILRHYSDVNRLALANRLSTLCRRRGIALMIAGDWRLAATVSAAGIHLAEYAARSGPGAGGRLWLRRLHRRGQARLLTVTAHNATGLRRAEALQASAAVLAPVFVTASHPGRRPLGATRAAAMTGAVRIPVLALGGITAATVSRLRHGGYAGVAGISFALL